MLTVEQINEISFGTAGFNKGYKAEDVDNFIDQVEATVRQLQEEKEAALRKVAELTARTAETQEKLAILAEKVEAYRREEDEIKNAILSAQKISNASIQEAKDKAALMLKDARDAAEKTVQTAQETADRQLRETEEMAASILKNARTEAEKSARAYIDQTDTKKKELEEMKKQVSAFRSSLLEMYKKHLEQINHIPSFRLKPEPQPEEQTAVPEAPPVQTQEVAQVIRDGVPQAETPLEAAHEADRRAPRKAENAEAPRAAEKKDVPPALERRHDYSKEQATSADEQDLASVGINTQLYRDIPEPLKKEKQSHYSHLEFGNNIDVTNA